MLHRFLNLIVICSIWLPVICLFVRESTNRRNFLSLYRHLMRSYMNLCGYLSQTTEGFPQRVSLRSPASKSTFPWRLKLWFSLGQNHEFLGSRVIQTVDRHTPVIVFIRTTHSTDLIAIDYTQSEVSIQHQIKNLKINHHVWKSRSLLSDSIWKTGLGTNGTVFLIFHYATENPQ